MSTSATALRDTRGQRGRVTLRSYRYVWVGALLALIYWLFESVLHAVLFDQGAVSSHLLPADAHELWKRLLIVALLVFLGAYAQHGINAQRRVERALKKSERRYRTLVQEALNPIFVVDRGGRVLDCNQAASDFFERERVALVDGTYAELVGGRAGPPPVGLSELDVTVGASVKTLLVNVVHLPTFGDDSAYCGIGQDITARKRFRSNLQLAHRELTQIFQTASSAMRLIDREGRVLKVNDAFVELAGVTAEDAVGAPCFEVFAGDRCGTPECPLRQILAGRKQVDFRIQKSKRDGTALTCQLTARPFFGADGAAIGVVESFNDVTELVHTRDALRSERDKLRGLLFQQYEGVAILRADHTIAFQNEALARDFGDCSHRRCYEAFFGADRPCAPCHMREAFARDTRCRCELESVDGRVREHTYTPFRDTDGDLKALVYLRDVTDLRASRAAAIQAEQLAAIGVLAAGVAHEINSPINGIINYAQMMLARERDAGECREICRRIVAEGDRIAHIVSSLLSYARRGGGQRSPVSMEELLTDVLTLIAAQLKKDAIVLDVRVAEGLPLVCCVPQEIEQVFLNILGNARDALNARTAGRAEPKRLEIVADVDHDSGRWVRVGFRDNGVGIPEAIRDKVTTPFFTTKPRGEGTGLGLSVSQEIVSNHGGRLDIRCGQGPETLVEVRLPEVAR